jgi:hypothetical protein
MISKAHGPLAVARAVICRVHTGLRPTLLDETDVWNAVSKHGHLNVQANTWQKRPTSGWEMPNVQPYNVDLRGGSGCTA